MPTSIALPGLAKDLALRGQAGKPIRICLVGTGEMATDSASRVAQRQGIAIGAISGLKPGAARRTVEIAYGKDPAIALKAAIHTQNPMNLTTDAQTARSLVTVDQPVT